MKDNRTSTMLGRLVAVIVLLGTTPLVNAGAVSMIDGEVDVKVLGPPSTTQIFPIPDGSSFSASLPIDNPQPSSFSGPKFTLTKTDVAADQTKLVFDGQSPTGVSNNPPPDNPAGYLKSGSDARLRVLLQKPTQVDINIPPGDLNLDATDFKFTYPGGIGEAFFKTTDTGFNTNFPIDPNTQFVTAFNDSFVLGPGEHMFQFILFSEFPPDEVVVPAPGPELAVNVTFTTIPTPTAALAGLPLLLGMFLSRWP